MIVFFDIILPLFGGAIGSIVTIFGIEIQNKQIELPWKVMWRYICLGAISGFLAVSLLNPDGAYQQTIPLAIVAGLSPISYLRSQSMTNGSDEENAFQDYLKSFSKDPFKEDFEIDTSEIDDEEIFLEALRDKIKDYRGDDEHE